MHSVVGTTEELRVRQRPGITWDFKRRSGFDRGSLRRFAVAATIAAGTAAGGPFALADGPSGSTSSPSASTVKMSPVWADPLIDGRTPAGATTTAPLPTLAQVEQVIGAPAAWSAGYAGQGVDVAVIDSGVSPVGGLAAPGK